MPGNELGDRVHNFFAQDNLSQGQHEAHVLEGNWPVHNHNFWAGSQRQLDGLNSSRKNYNPQNPEIDRGQPSYPVHAGHGLNFSQSNLRPDFPRSQSLHEQQYSNGFMYGNQFYQNRQNEANFLAVDTNSDHQHVIASRGLSAHELQQGNGHEQPPKTLDRLESAPSVSFDLFGGQQRMSHQQASMLQVLQRQQSGFNDMQQLQKQLMLRKMQELQRQPQFQQLDLRHQNLINQVPPLTRPASGSHSSLVNGTPNSDSSRYSWTAEPNTNWLTGGSSAMQGSSSENTFTPNHSQTQHFMNLVPQQVDHSLYGFPVSNSRGLSVNQYPQIVTERSLMPQIATSSNSLHDNQHNFLRDQSSGQDGISMTRQKFQNENSDRTSSHLINTGIMDMGFVQQVNSLQKDPKPDFPVRQELSTRSETSHEISKMQVSSPRDEVTLDPTEEKILYGSNDNKWAAFGKSPNVSGEAGDLFDTGDLSMGLSMQSGSWSALMQSAVAETSSNDIGPQEEWSGVIFHNADGSSTNQFPSVHNDKVKQICLPSDSVRGHSPPSKFNTHPMGSDQHGHSFQKELSERVPTDNSQRFGQSFEGASQIHGASQNSLNAERNPKTISAAWAPIHSGNRPQPNGWSALAAVSPGGDGVSNIHEAVTGNHQVKKGALSLHDTTSSVKNSFNMGVGDGASPFVQNNNLLNQWKNASPSAKFKVGEGLGRMMDQDNEQNQGSFNRCDKEVTRYKDNCAMKENSSDSHHSSLSRHASGGFKDSGFSDAIESRSLSSGKQKSTNQLANKVPVTRKFQYHPMGNLDEDVETSHGLKQPTQGQAISLQNAHLGQSKLFGQYSGNSTEKVELPQDFRGPDKEPSSGSFSGYAPPAPVPFNRSFNSHTNIASSSSQNMLELLHKVDQSGDHGSVVQFTSDSNASSQLPEADKKVGFAQHSQCSSSQGFGLQLGPPSQLLQNPDFSSPSQNAEGTIGSIHASHAGTKMGERAPLMVPPISVQSLPFPNEESHTENGSNRAAGGGYLGSNNSLYNGPENHYAVCTSDTSYARSQLQNKQTRVSGKVATDWPTGSSVSSYSLHSKQRGLEETVLPGVPGNLNKNNLASSVSIAQQDGGYGVKEMDPVGTASTRDQGGSKPFGLPDISQQRVSSQFLHNMWTNVPMSQHTLAAQYPKAQNFSELPQPTILESGAQGNLDDGKRGHISSMSNTILANSSVDVDGQGHRSRENSGQLASFEDNGKAQKPELPLRRASSIKNQSDDSPANSASTQDIEAFGRSLKPNIFSNENFALLDQMRAMKDADNDPSIRFSKRLKVSENILDIRQANPTTGKQSEDKVEDSLGSNNEIPSADSRMRSFSSQYDALQRKTLLHENATSEDNVAGLHDSQSNPSTTDCIANRVELHSVSPQMAPSWFNQYGSFKNWQTLPLQGAQMRPEEPPVTLRNSSSVVDIPNLEDKSTAPVDACQAVNTLRGSAPMSEGNDLLTSAESLQLNLTGKHQVVLRPKKRKSATSELCPWYKEISDGSRSLSVLSVAEADWSKAANRLTEKVEDDVELVEDGLPFLRWKRRLLTTTQLMQQLLSPPPATLLSADFSFNYESVAYAVSRVLLGDACTALPGSRNQCLPCDDTDLHAVKGKLNGDPCFDKIVEDLLGKARKLENDLLRLDKSASILDLRLECQDLEKFSVINRFAKFHGRGQGDKADASSTEATITTHKLYAQRYVTAVPMPRSLPDRVQCLSL